MALFGLGNANSTSLPAPPLSINTHAKNKHNLEIQGSRKSQEEGRVKAVPPAPRRKSVCGGQNKRGGYAWNTLPEERK